MAPHYHIGIFDDHPVFTVGLKNLLSKYPEMSLDVAADSRASLMDELQEKKVDVLILDVVAPDVSGLELFKTIQHEYPEIKVIAYTTLGSPILVENLLNSGVFGYLNKRQSPTEVAAAILQVCKGDRYVPDEYLFLLQSETLHPIAVELTPREQEILTLVLDGKLSKEIAFILQISQNTVENHRTSLFKKFEVANLAELFKQAVRLGYWID